MVGNRGTDEKHRRKGQGEILFSGEWWLIPLEAKALDDLNDFVQLT
jgi:hypothetical protein